MLIVPRIVNALAITGLLREQMLAPFFAETHEMPARFVETESPDRMRSDHRRRHFPRIDVCKRSIRSPLANCGGFRLQDQRGGALERLIAEDGAVIADFPV